MKWDKSKEAENRVMPPKEAARRYVGAVKAFLGATEGLSITDTLEGFAPNIEPRWLCVRLRESAEAVEERLAKQEAEAHDGVSGRDGPQEGRDDAHTGSGG